MKKGRTRGREGTIKQQGEGMKMIGVNVNDEGKEEKNTGKGERLESEGKQVKEK